MGDPWLIFLMLLTPPNIVNASTVSHPPYSGDKQEPVVVLEQVSKRYGSINALSDVSLTIGHGITGLLGPNGAGKSTLVKTMLGLLRMSSGQGRVLGFDCRHQALDIRAAVGTMPEDDCYVPGLTGVQMVRYAARLSGLERVESLRRAHEVLDWCGMTQERYRPVETYSSGMRQKLSFAQALVHDPKLVILDEPTAGLDPSERRDMLGRINTLARIHGKAVILSTHILPDVQAVCDWVVVLCRGRVKLSGALEDLTRPLFPMHRLCVRGDASAMVQRLEHIGIRAEITFDGSITLHGVDGSTVSGVWRLAADMGFGVTSLEPMRTSLETLFVDAVREHSHAAG